MSFASPATLCVLLILFPVVLAFLVRRHHETLRVPSTMLFRRVARSVAPTRRIRHLRRLLSLAMCVVAIVALVLAAARPTRRKPGPTTAFVVDVSASMAAGGRSAPLERARRFLAESVENAHSSDRFVLIAAGAEPEHLVGPVPPGPELNQAIAHLRAGRSTADRRAAVALARELVAPFPSGRVVILDDGGAVADDSPSDPALPGVSEHVFAPTPEQLDNLGISSLFVRTPEDADGDGEREVVALVSTASKVPRAARIILTADGREVARRAVDIPPGKDAEARLRLHVGASNIEARIEPADGRADSLALDDYAHLIGKPAARPRALIPVAGCTKECDGPTDGTDRPSAFFVEHALRAAGIAEIHYVSADIPDAAVRSGDVMVALGEGPSRLVRIPSIYVATTRGNTPVGIRASLRGDQTRLRSVDATDPLLRGVVLDGVRIEQAIAISAPQYARTLVDLDGGPVIARGGAEGSLWVYLGIHPAFSDVGLKVAFPILVANALQVVCATHRVTTAETVPRAEIRMSSRPGAREGALRVEPEPRWRFHVSTSAALSAVAAMLLLVEMWAFRGGWST